MLSSFRRHPWLAGGFLAACVVTVFFGTRAVVYTVYWSDPAHRDQPIEGWMTTGYVANSWGIPRSELQAALGDIAQPGERKTLEQLAEDAGLPVSGVIARIETAIDDHRDAQ